MSHDTPRPSRKFLRNPVKRFGELKLESQTHNPLVGIFDANSAFISTEPSRPLTLLFARDSDGDKTSAAHSWFTEGEMSSYSVLTSNNDSNSIGDPLCVIRSHHRSMWTYKRTVYAAPPLTANGAHTLDKEGNKVGLPMFNVRKAPLGRPKYYAHGGAHSGAESDGAAAHPAFANRPFMVMTTSNNSTEFVTHFKFTATVSSIRAPTGDVAVDSVMAVERTSQLMVLASTNIRDVFVILRSVDDKWSWMNEHAPGMLIASGRPMDSGTANSELVGPLAMKIQVAPGVDGRIILAVVVAAVTHFQAY